MVGSGILAKPMGELEAFLAFFRDPCQSQRENLKLSWLSSVTLVKEVELVVSRRLENEAELQTTQSIEMMPRTNTTHF